jgi:hypothetical protein
LGDKLGDNWQSQLQDSDAFNSALRAYGSGLKWGFAPIPGSVFLAEHAIPLGLPMQSGRANVVTDFNPIDFGAAFVAGFITAPAAMLGSSAGGNVARSGVGAPSVYNVADTGINLAGVNNIRQTGAFSAIGSTGRIGADALAELGGQSNVYFATSQGGRYVDQLVQGVANESKVGYQSLTGTIGSQVAKDAELLQAGRIKAANWHFFTSPVTGQIGGSAPLLDALNKAGIGVVVH